MRRLLLLLILVPILGGMAWAGLQLSKSPKPDYSHLTAEQVISYVQVYALPKYEPAAAPIGQWAAVYEGAGKWQVRGEFISGDNVWVATWIFDNGTIIIPLPTPTPYTIPRFGQ